MPKVKSQTPTKKKERDQADNVYGLNFNLLFFALENVDN